MLLGGDRSLGIAQIAYPTINLLLGERSLKLAYLGRYCLIVDTLISTQKVINSISMISIDLPEVIISEITTHSEELPK